MDLTGDQSRFVEHAGRFWESVSLGRTAGRILGLLMICEPDHQSAAELVDTLGISSGSVSMQTRQLERLGLVERLTFPGDRASYYRLPDQVWTRTIDAELDRIAAMRKLAEAGEEVLPDNRPERITELRRVVEFFAGAWPRLIEQLTQELNEGVS